VRTQSGTRIGLSEFRLRSLISGSGRQDTQALNPERGSAQDSFGMQLLRSGVSLVTSTRYGKALALGGYPPSHFRNGHT
jgi:hypothetical protein